MTCIVVVCLWSYTFHLVNPCQKQQQHKFPLKRLLFCVVTFLVKYSCGRLKELHTRTVAAKRQRATPPCLLEVGTDGRRRALAENNHHSAPRRPTMERGQGGGVTRCQKTPPLRAASTVHFSMDDDGDVLAARPTPLAEVRPQSGVQRHTAVHIVDVSPFVQILDVPVPTRRRQSSRLSPCLKISLDRIPQRSAVRRPQKAETVGGSCPRSCPSLLYSSGLPCDLPAPGRGGGGGRGGLPDRIQQHGLWSRKLTLQFPEVACMIFQIMAVQAHPQCRVMGVWEGGFSDFFTRSKKVRSHPPF